MKKLLFSLGIFILIVLFSSFSLSVKERIKTTEVVDLSMKFYSEQETSFPKDILSSNFLKDAVGMKTEEVDFYEINITIKLPSGEEVGFFQKSISNKYTSGKGEWDRWTASALGHYNHTKILEKIEEVLKKY